MLRTKSIYATPSVEDGLRVCVMARLTDDDGKTPVRSFVIGKRFDYWAKILAPPPKLVGAWYRDEVDWKQFEAIYTSHLTSEHITPHIDLWSGYAKDSDITLLCTEDSPHQCHRRLLAEYCKQRHPELEVLIE